SRERKSQIPRGLLSPGALSLNSEQSRHGTALQKRIDRIEVEALLARPFRSFALRLASFILTSDR
ncbi:MAG: hypothetical protein NZP34_09295, partial [Caldilineales bacterium]|nr:hypothetical protein [Caldilineales bacterium]